MKRPLQVALLVLLAFSCKKKNEGAAPVVPAPVPGFGLASLQVNGVPATGLTAFGVPLRQPQLQLAFTAPLDRASVGRSLSFQSSTGSAVTYSLAYAGNDSVLQVTPATALQPLTRYSITLSGDLRSATGGAFSPATTLTIFTGIDSSDKFPVLSDTALVEQTQLQAFRYFYDFGHPVSGLARERNTSGDVVTSGGSGFGIMALLVGAHRNFITRAQALQRLQTTVAFLENTAQTFHGAYPHWLNGVTGVVIPFSPADNGADLVETSYLVQGLLCARQYFSGAAADEAALRNDINTIVDRVEWDWFRKGGEQVLYWHWSPSGGWAMNMPIRGWNECLITYVLAASSNTHSIPRSVYDQGWAQSGGMRNGSSYYGHPLPLGPAYGGPLFFSHYSFLGLDPNGLTDAYANYTTQVVNHALINHDYCVANPRKYYGYSDQCWGLTASDIPNGYTASSPTNDVGVLAPTAALSSFPYTPAESMKALRFFYYKLGDRLWSTYGPHDAFRLQDPWFADSYLAIDQGPIVVMMENYRSGLLWNLFTSCPEVKNGLRNLGFSAPYL
ncbi:glucoamylase family protein [Flaviaesturariibacter aridisoli]|uniref:Beta-glucosidase n=1 Tax=Flaviaesturariibacter aridisoli TaxID=2545761 RepID=A0A4R4DZR5_9BACT|nr:glucoamylase family protein [Flaviaesturariibacter aridisoli]TCZ72239.1 beta-glucosidase [Flaviaesturariibacter aridisoli]